MRVAWRRGVVSRSAVVWSLFTYQHMKLHLPSRLRKALLACLAALAAALPSTLGSATMSFWALAALAMQEKAVAADFTASKTGKDGQEYSGRIVTWDVNKSVANNGYYFFYANGNPAGNLSLWSADTDDASATWFAASSSQTFESAGDVAARNVYAYFWSVNGGDRGQTLRFIDSGTDGGQKDLRIYLSSSRKYSFTLGGLIVEAGSTDYVLGTDSRDVEGTSTGVTFQLQAGTGHTTFEASVQSNFTFQGATTHLLSDANLRIAKGKTLDFSTGLAVMDSKNITVEVAGDTGDGSATLSVSGISGSAGNVTVGAGAKWVIGGGTLGITGQLSLAAGSALDLTGVTLNLTGSEALTAPLGGSESGFALNVSGENVLSLSGTSLWGGESNLLTLSELTGAGALTIELSEDLLTGKGDTGSMNLIGGWKSEWEDHLNVRLTGEEAGGWVVSINESGQLTWVKGESLTWTGTGEDTTLTLGTSTGSGGNEWSKEDHTFVASDALTLTAAVPTTVQLGEESTLSIRSLTLSAGADAESASFAFSAGEAPSAEKVLAVAEDVNVNTDTTLGTQFVLQVGSLSSIKLAEGKSLTGDGAVRVQLASDETRNTTWTANTNLEISGGTPSR